MAEYVAGWQDKLISYNLQEMKEKRLNVAGWQDKLISYNDLKLQGSKPSVAGWQDKLISYNRKCQGQEKQELQVDRTN